jgi:hypothetical protein
MKRTPLADTLLVTALNSSASVERITGRLKGNRTAQRTSCRGTPLMLVGETVNPGLDGFIALKSPSDTIQILYLK